MKDKKLIVLYLAMLVIGFALLFTKSANKNDSQQPSQPVEQPEEQKQMEYISVAVVNRDTSKGTIFTDDDYSFKNIEVVKNSLDKAKYVTSAREINTYVAKNHIQQGSMIEKDFIASPGSSEYMSLSLNDGEYIFPFIMAKEDIYLIKNLGSGDLVDIYVLYGAEQKNNRPGEPITYSSPSRNFTNTNIKPMIVGKKILFVEELEGRINLALSNEEIKLVRTLMTNATVLLYPSTSETMILDGMTLLDDREKRWPISEQSIFNSAQINRLRGN